MRNLPRIIRDLAIAAALLVGSARGGRALDVTNWQHRQSLPIDRPGVIKIQLPPATLDLVRPQFEDLRLLDPAGREVPFAIERAAATAMPSQRINRPFRAQLVDRKTELVLQTETSAPLLDVTLSSSTPAFLKPAQVEVSADGDHWQFVSRDVPVFRQYGADQLRLDLDRRSARFIRVTLDDSRTRPIAVTGMSLGLAATTTPAVTTPLPVRLVQREEFTGETVLTVNVGGANVSLASLRFDSTEPLFARNVTVAVREIRDGSPHERTLAQGVIYRLVAEGVPETARLDLPLDVIVPAREILVHLANGDSPPLALSTLTASERPTWLVFSAAAAGTLTVLSGNPDVPAARYDVGALAPSYSTLAVSAVRLGPAEPVPGYQRPDALANLVLRGGPIDPTAWAFRKPVQVARPGVQQLELDLDVLAGAERDLSDLRLVREGAQVPYLLERSTLSRPAALQFRNVPDGRRPSLSRWEVKLPRTGVPLTHLTLTSPATLFERQIRVYEQRSNDRGGEFESTLAAGTWSKTPGNDRALVLPLSNPPTRELLYLETDNGDNPPLVLGTLTASYPVSRLLFKTDVTADAPGSLALYYGNSQAAAPRYDLNLIAARLITAEKTVAALGPEESGRAGGAAKTGARAGLFFWVVLGLVVVVLLFVVARLLPKAPASP